jgi:hypothetical protein
LLIFAQDKLHDLFIAEILKTIDGDLIYKPIGLIHQQEINRGVLKNTHYEVDRVLVDYGYVKGQPKNLSPLMPREIEFFFENARNIGIGKLTNFLCYVFALHILCHTSQLIKYNENELSQIIKDLYGRYQKRNSFYQKMLSNVINTHSNELERLTFKRINGVKSHTEPPDDIRDRIYDATQRVLDSRKLTSRDASIIKSKLESEGYIHDIQTVRKHFKNYLNEKGEAN